MALAPVAENGVGLVYALQIDDRRFDAYLDDDGAVTVVDTGTGGTMPAGTATFDEAAGTITFHVARDYLARRFDYAPYSVFGRTGREHRFQGGRSRPDVEEPDWGGHLHSYRGGHP